MSRSGTFSEQDLHFSGICGSVSTEFERFARANLFFMCGKITENHFEICMTEDQLRGISSIGLAHLGDAVFELLVRGWLCQHGKATGKGLHQATIQLVRAEHQAACAEKILPMLTEEELAVFRRGRNAQVHSIPSHASRAQYSTATALEALFGWLYLGGQRQRASDLFDVMMEE